MKKKFTFFNPKASIYLESIAIITLALAIICILVALNSVAAGGKFLLVIVLLYLTHAINSLIYGMVRLFIQPESRPQTMRIAIYLMPILLTGLVISYVVVIWDVAIKFIYELQSILYFIREIGLS